MADFDVFNGDADGICALVQLRRARPRDGAALVTGVKRDIALLGRVECAAGDRITVLDVSMRNNREALDGVLSAGAEVFYADHHNPGEIPSHARLTALIDTDPGTCTSLIVDRHLGGASREWAITAAFGDGLQSPARHLAQKTGLDDAGTQQLAALGTLMNYNGYGAVVDDLHFAPEALYRAAVRFSSPFAFLAERSDVFDTLETGYWEDMAAAKAATVLNETPTGLVLALPDAPSSRRASGVFGNELAADHPGRAHALLTDTGDGGYLVSVRAPKDRPEGADRLCLAFETGGGRAGAAGINHLPHADVDAFVTAFRAAWR